MSEKANQAFEIINVGGVEVRTTKKFADWAKQTREKLKTPRDFGLEFQSHDALKRHIKAVATIGPYARAYAFVLNNLAKSENFEIRTTAHSNFTSLSMVRPTYETAGHNATYSAFQEKHGKEITTFNCHMSDHGFVLNSCEKSMTWDQTQAIIEKRVDRMGEGFRTLFDRYIATNGQIDPARKKELSARHAVDLSGAVENVRTKPMATRKAFFGAATPIPRGAFAYEIKEFLLPLYKAFHHALKQERRDVGDICMDVESTMVRLYIEMTDTTRSRCMEINCMKHGYSQNPMATLSGIPLADDAKQLIPFRELLDVLEGAVNARGEEFKANYNAYLRTGGFPELEKSKPQTVKKLSLR